MVGMRPSVYSSKRREADGTKWRRDGQLITYKRNSGGSDDSAGSTLSFSYTFEYDCDCVYFANCYPYTYSRLIKWLRGLKRDDSLKDLLKVRKLCYTLACNKCMCCVITEGVASEADDTRLFSEKEHDEDEKRIRKPAIVVTARVHPGESNSSFVAEGLIKFLLSQDCRARKLRSMFVFYVVPMLNPDGVTYGNHRCSLTGTDLNRIWISPRRSLHPTIYFAKQLIGNLAATGRVVSFCDLHGHSTNKDAFLLGCQVPMTGLESQERNRKIRNFARILARMSRCFSLLGSKFVIEKNKLSTGRIVVFREFAILQSYTLETSCYGSEAVAGHDEPDRKKDCNFLPDDLNQIGRALALAYLVQGTVTTREELVGTLERKDVDEIIGWYGKELGAAPSRHPKATVARLVAPPPAKRAVLVHEKSRNRLSRSTDATSSAAGELRAKSDLAVYTEQHAISNKTVAVVELSYPHPDPRRTGFSLYRRLNNMMNRGEPPTLTVLSRSKNARSCKPSLDRTLAKADEKGHRYELLPSIGEQTKSSCSHHRVRLSFDKYVKQFKPENGTRCRYFFAHNGVAMKTSANPGRQSLVHSRLRRAIDEQNEYQPLSATMDSAKVAAEQTDAAALSVYRSMNMRWSFVARKSRKVRLETKGSAFSTVFIMRER